MDKTIFEKTKEMIDSYYEDTIDIVDGLEYSQWDTIKQIYFYSSSKYLSNIDNPIGAVSSEMIDPFFNIINAPVNTAVRLTDFDTKDIGISAKKPMHQVKSMLLSKDIKNWMKEVRFARTLNKMGKARARFGGVAIKKVMTDGELDIQVVPWKNFITDQTNFDDGVKIEIHYLTADKVKEKDGVWDNIDDALELVSKKEMVGETLDKETTTDKLEVIEVEGVFKQSVITGNEQNENFTLQRHIIAFGNNEDSFDDGIVLFQEELKETNYKYLPWEALAGRTLGIGIVEDGFQAQIWTNNAKIKEKEAMELSSKLIFKTDDDNLYENILNDMDNGEIVHIQEGRDFAQINTVSNAIPAFDNLIGSWRTQLQEATSTYAAVTGEEMPANTTLGAVQITNFEARHQFDYRREEMGIFLEEVFKEWIMPHIIKKINREHILHADFTPEELMHIDEEFKTDIANKIAIEKVLGGQAVTAVDYEMYLKMAEAGIPNNNKRFIKIPKDYFKNIDAEVDIITTNESFNKRVVLDSLQTILSLVGSNPMLVQDPRLTPILAQMIEIADVGVNVSELLQPIQQPEQQEQLPQEVTADLGQALQTEVESPNKLVNQANE